MPEIDINAMSDEEFVEYIDRLENESDEGFAGAVVDGVPNENGADEGAASGIDAPAVSDQGKDGVEGTQPPASTEAAPYDKGVADGRNTRLLSHIKKLYPDLDEGAAVERFLEDADRDAATAAGLSLEDYRKGEEERAAFAEFQAERENRKRRDEESEAIAERWRVDEQTMKGILPDFSFEKAMENGQFRDKILKEGKDIISAYFELNPINKAPAESVRRDIEVGDMSGGVSGGFKSPFDIERASREEFNQYINKILEKE